MSSPMERPGENPPGPLDESRSLADMDRIAACHVAGCVRRPVKMLGTLHYCQTHLSDFVGPIWRKVLGLAADANIGRLRYVRPANAPWLEDFAWLVCDRCGYECVEKWLGAPFCHRCVARWKASRD